MTATLIVILIVALTLICSIGALVIAQSIAYGTRESEWPDA